MISPYRTRKAALGAVLLLIGAACNRQPIHVSARAAAPTGPAAQPSGATPSYGQLPEFNLIDQDGAPFTRERLRGKVSIANFIYTTCAMECPMLTARMAVLQRRLAGQDASIQLVSISIAPDTDTPAVLKAYGARYHQDPARWSFLTGKTDPLLLAVTEAYKQAPPVKALAQNATGFLALHGEAFVLLDGEGRVRGYGDKSDSGLDGLISTAIKLRAESTANWPVRN